MIIVETDFLVRMLETSILFRKRNDLGEEPLRRFNPEEMSAFIQTTSRDFWILLLSRCPSRPGSRRVQRGRGFAP